MCHIQKNIKDLDKNDVFPRHCIIKMKKKLYFWGKLNNYDESSLNIKKRMYFKETKTVIHAITFMKTPIRFFKDDNIV